MIATNIQRVFGPLALSASPWALILGAALVSPAPADASTRTVDDNGSSQASASSDSEASPAGVAEVVVTAQKRSESLKDVPLSVQAYTTEELHRQAIVDTRDLAAVSPTLNFSTGNSTEATSFSLRGVSSLTVQLGIQPSTALVIDGVPVYRQTEFVTNLSDVERIEVLNGPQGTLFGKNSTAGVINVVTAQPTSKAEGEIESSVTSDEETNIRGMVNVPISDRARVRVNAFYQDQKPLIKNLSGEGIVGQRAYGARAKLAFDFTDNATFTLSGTYSHFNSSAGQDLAVGPSLFEAQFLQAGGIFGRGKTTININTPVQDIVESKNVIGTFNWNLSDHWSLVSISSYTEVSEESATDPDLTPCGDLFGVGVERPNCTLPVLAPFGGFPRFPDNYHYFSQELRVNYAAGPANIIAGGYMQDLRDRYLLRLPLNYDGSLLGLTPGNRYFFMTEPRASLHDTTESPLFADATYALTNQFKVFAGVRYTRERVAVGYHRESFLGPYADYNPVTGVFADPPVSTYDTKGLHTVDNVSGRAGVQYQPTRDLNFYASYARGYKGPAVDVGQPLAVGKDPILKPETADAVEIGAKLRFFDNNVALNIALFHEVIHNIQEAIISNATTFVPNLVNAGDLTTRGVEADGQWFVTPDLRLSGSVDYDKATYGNFGYVCNSTQFQTGTCPNAPGPGLQNVSGQPAVGAPRLKYAVGADYQNRLRGTGLSYYGQVNWTWTDAIQYSLGNDPLTREPAHGMLNASIGLRGIDDRWEVQIFGKNLTNRFYYGDLTDLAVFGAPLGWLARDFHRYGGIRIVARF
jgi:iron complex outermembrane recepter protein